MHNVSNGMLIQNIFINQAWWHKHLGGRGRRVSLGCTVSPRTAWTTDWNPASKKIIVISYELGTTPGLKIWGEMAPSPSFIEITHTEDMSKEVSRQTAWFQVMKRQHHQSWLLDPAFLMVRDVLSPLMAQEWDHWPFPSFHNDTTRSPISTWHCL